MNFGVSDLLTDVEFQFCLGLAHCIRNIIPKSKAPNLVHFLGKIFSTKRCNAFFVKRRSMWITWNLNKGANSSSWSILKLIKMQKGNVARKSSKLRDFYCFLSSKSLTKGNFKKFKEIYQIFNSLMYWPESIEESNTSFFLKSLDLSTTMVIVLKPILLSKAHCFYLMLNFFLEYFPKDVKPWKFHWVKIVCLLLSRNCQEIVEEQKLDNTSCIKFLVAIFPILNKVFLIYSIQSRKNQLRFSLEEFNEFS